MNTNEYLNFLEKLDDDDALDAHLQFDAQRHHHPKGRISKKLESEERAFIDAQDDSRASFNFTYKASRHESGWLLDSLGTFYEQKWISDVLRQIKGGKEASVYLCKSGISVDAPYLAVKVYRPRQFRNLKNDSQYRVGREELDENGNVIVDDGALYAISKRTAYGEKLRHQSWIAYEFQAMQILNEAGADVPIPYAMENNAILMEYIGALDMAAPTLQSLDFKPAEAQTIFDRTLINLNIMLEYGFVHGDLSAYNILYWADDIALIDFPQVISPERNPSAWSIFLRDVTRLCQYFEKQGIDVNSKEIAKRIWRAHGHRVRKEVDPRYLDADSADDRHIWEQQLK